MWYLVSIDRNAPKNAPVSQIGMLFHFPSRSLLYGDLT